MDNWDYDWNAIWNRVQEQLDSDLGRVKCCSNRAFPFILAFNIVKYIPHGILNLLHNKTWTGWPKNLDHVDEDKINEYLQSLLDIERRSNNAA